MNRLGNKSASYLSELSHKIEPWKSAKTGEELRPEKSIEIEEIIEQENKIKQIMGY